MQSRQNLYSAGLRSKILSGKLSGKGSILIPPSKIAISALNYKEPNFVLSAYVFIKPSKYWVSSRVFIDEKGISIEASPTFRGYPYRIVIHYYE